MQFCHYFGTLAHFILTQLIITHLFIFGNCLKYNFPKYCLAPFNRSSFYALFIPYPEITIYFDNGDQFGMYMSGNIINIAVSYFADKPFECFYRPIYRPKDVMRDKLPLPSVLSMHLSDDAETFYPVSINIRKRLALMRAWQWP